MTPTIPSSQWLYSRVSRGMERRRNKIGSRKVMSQCRRTRSLESTDQFVIHNLALKIVRAEEFVIWRSHEGIGSEKSVPVPTTLLLNPPGRGTQGCSKDP